MREKVKRSVRVFRTLTEEEKREFLEAIKGYEIKKALEESVVRDASMIMGPLGTTCPYCGK